MCVSDTYLFMGISRRFADRKRDFLSLKQSSENFEIYSDIFLAI